MDEEALIEEIHLDDAESPNSSTVNFSSNLSGN